MLLRENFPKHMFKAVLALASSSRAAQKPREDQVNGSMVFNCCNAQISDWANLAAT